MLGQAFGSTCCNTVLLPCFGRVLARTAEGQPVAGPPDGQQSSTRKKEPEGQREKREREAKGREGYDPDFTALRKIWVQVTVYDWVAV